MNEKNGQVTLSNGQIARVIKTTYDYKNIIIVELEGILRVVDKESKTLARTLGEGHNKHAYNVRRSSKT